MKKHSNENTAKDASFYHDGLSYMLVQDRVDQVCDYYRKVLLLDPANVEAHRNLGKALRQKGEIELAIQHLEYALLLKKNNINAYHKLPRIFYFCPDMKVKSGGVRRLYRHVEILVRNGFPASILHERKDFVITDQPKVPVNYLENRGVLRVNDIVVIPEGFPGVMYKLKDLQIRRFVIALSWSYIFPTLPDTIDWRAFNIERVMVVCPFIGELVSWSMGLPTHLLDFGINPELYHYQPEAKKLKISFIQHKAQDIDAFKRLLRARNKSYVDNIKWKALCDLSEEEYAAQIRESSVFLNLSTAEGLLTSCLEAMLTGCIVAGFNSVGGVNTLIGKGINQNCILAQNGDYVSLAYKIEPLLNDLFAGRRDNWEDVIQKGIQTSLPHTPASEEKSVVAFWNNVLLRKGLADEKNCHHIPKG